MSPKPDGTLLVGDDHNLTSNRTRGDPHPQYHHKLRKLLAAIGADLACPVVINEAGNPCDPVLRVESDTDENFIYLLGIGGGILGIALQGEPLVDQNFNVKLGGPAESDTRRQLLIEGRTVEALVVTGGYGLGGDPMFQIHTFSNKVEAVVDGDITMTRRFNITHISQAITVNYNPLPTPTHSIVRLTSDVDGRQIQSITEPAQQDLDTTPIVDFINGGSFYITFVNQHPGAAANDRIIASANNSNFDLMPNDTCRIWYDTVSARWRVLK